MTAMAQSEVRYSRPVSLHMPDPVPVYSKLSLNEPRTIVPVDVAVRTVAGIFETSGCDAPVARQIAEHLADANLCGMESHGLVRTMQYTEQFESGYMNPAARAELQINAMGAKVVDGHGGHGIPAMHLAVEAACADASRNRVSVIAVRNIGHTGRLGAFTEIAADKGHLCIVFGGGNRKTWRQVAPYGGRLAMLPTNPYSIGAPGGDRGPVIMDCATSRISGGWVYAAHSAGAQLPDNAVMDRSGNPTRNPGDYFDGGAILPAGGAMGYAMALVAELVSESVLGPNGTEANWLMITLDTAMYRDAQTRRRHAEEILDELRNCPPAPGHQCVEIPGERERDHRRRNADRGVALPARTWAEISGLSNRLTRDRAS